MSGLRFHLPLGLFLDIGGGSVELAVANTTNTYCLFSLPLGAVRLTEKLIAHDPPRHREIKELRAYVQPHSSRWCAASRKKNSPWPSAAAARSPPWQKPMRVSPVIRIAPDH